MAETADFVILGGGVIGLNLALEAKRRHPASRVILLEKERRCGMHASGRNSGVLHAGFYYTADSLKARFTREGNKRLTQYCLERGLRIRRCGKLVVARHAGELSGLDELKRRGERNGIELHEVSEKEAREIEPRVRTFERALYSPTTASVDPVEVMSALEEEARSAGILIREGVAYRGRKGRTLHTTSGNIAPGYLINAAGLYADQIARDFGFCQDYTILPFKGLYLYSEEPPGSLRTNVYPVPDLRNPFLGVHFTVTVDGGVKIGPTATPAFWREHYHGLDNFRWKECASIVQRQIGLLMRNDFGFRRLAFEELRKHLRSHMVSQASQLVRGAEPKLYRRWGKPGIRAQLYDLRRRRLEMDFRFEGDDFSLHVLNAVSPAFTCSMPFTEFLFDRIEEGLQAA